MSTGSRGRPELLAAVARETRRLGDATAALTQGLAERAGLAPTDVQCLDFLAEAGSSPAGRLAELTGLSLGATTRLIDRLEQAGYVRRAADLGDRRVVLVELMAERAGVTAERVAALVRAVDAATAGSSDEALGALGGYLEGAVAAVEAETVRLRQHPATLAGGGSAFSAPVGGVTLGRLVFLSAVPTIAILGDTALHDLYRAGFQGPVPRVRVRAGVVNVRYARLAWFDWRARIGGQMIDTSVHWRDDRGQIALNTAVPWTIELRGGASRVDADLRKLGMRGFELTGGASRVELRLPRPEGVVPVRLSGSFNEVAVSRPTGCAVRLRIAGASGRVDVDGQVIAGSGGDLALDSDGAASAADRYEVDVRGSAHRLSVAPSDSRTL